MDIRSVGDFTEMSRNLVPCGGIEPPFPEYKTGVLKPLTLTGQNYFDVARSIQACFLCAAKRSASMFMTP